MRIALYPTDFFVYLGAVFGSPDYFHGLAIFLDTYSNHNGAHNVIMCYNLFLT